jgi:hypothetical protein
LGKSIKFCFIIFILNKKNKAFHLDFTLAIDCVLKSLFFLVFMFLLIITGPGVRRRKTHSYSVYLWSYVLEKPPTSFCVSISHIYIFLFLFIFYFLFFVILWGPRRPVNIQRPVLGYRVCWAMTYEDEKIQTECIGKEYIFNFSFFFLFLFFFILSSHFFSLSLFFDYFPFPPHSNHVLWMYIIEILRKYQKPS